MTPSRESIRDSEFEERRGPPIDERVDKIAEQKKLIESLKLISYTKIIANVLTVSSRRRSD